MAASADPETRKTNLGIGLMLVSVFLSCELHNGRTSREGTAMRVTATEQHDALVRLNDWLEPREL
jgi:hypothetical protein